MREKTVEHIKKSGHNDEISVGATEALTCRVVYARVFQSREEGICHLHHGRKYRCGPNEDGNILILREPFVSDASSAESYGPMETIDDFVKNALARIPEDWNAADRGMEEGCGTSCG